MGHLTRAIRGRFLRFRWEIVVVAYAIRHPERPLRLRLAGVALILYLASPIDFVPLWVPVAGILDDLVIVPWGLSRVVAGLSKRARADAEASAARFIGRYLAWPLRRGRITAPRDPAPPGRGSASEDGPGPPGRTPGRSLAPAGAR